MTEYYDSTVVSPSANCMLVSKAVTQDWYDASSVASNLPRKKRNENQTAIHKIEVHLNKWKTHAKQLRWGVYEQKTYGGSWLSVDYGLPVHMESTIHSPPRYANQGNEDTRRRILTENPSVQLF